MKKLVYAGAEVTTGDAIAVAVLEYCKALAEAQTSEVVEIPVLAADGSQISATFVVGPASQMLAVDVEDDVPEIIDPDTIARLERLTRSQRPTANAERGLASSVDRGWDEDF